MTSMILANKLSKSCHAQVTPIYPNRARLCPCVDKSENLGRKTSLQMTASVSIACARAMVNDELGNGERHDQSSK
jgi:hypothetical protein